MNEDNYAISVRGLTKRFGSFTAVDHISFDVGRGEIFGFLGANGAGKTTAMIKRRIGYMSQKFSLYEGLTVTENLRLFATIYGMSDRVIREQSNRVFSLLDMDNMRNTLVKDIPVGWKQKLAFASATIHRPDIVFLDEPTGGVDPVTRRKFWELIYRVSSEGMTVFVTTHYLDEAEYCNRVSIMVDGRITALDTPEALKSEYHADTMDQVFRIVARQATRGE